MILVLNCGSQSIKWKVFDSKLKVVKQNKLEVLNLNEYQRILEEELNKLKSFEISKIGHRVVHGGEKFREPTKITENVLKILETLSRLAPLHNPYNVLGIKACQKVFNPSAGSGQAIPQFAVFDTEFFADLPEKAFAYALPESVKKEFGFRKYGFHGTSHEYVARKAAKNLKKPFEKLKIITCHLGGGSSVTAIKNGKAVDTSMGFTPMEGLVMMTRSGSIDPGVILQMCEKLSVEKTKEILNFQSGIKGICGEGEMLRVLEQVKAGNKKFKLAFDVFVYSIQKYIGAYLAILGGCDALVFTGSIGSGFKITRERICKDLDILKNTKIFAIETDEELAIATKIKNLKI